MGAAEFEGRQATPRLTGALWSSPHLDSLTLSDGSGVLCATRDLASSGVTVPSGAAEEKGGHLQNEGTTPPPEGKERNKEVN